MENIFQKENKYFVKNNKSFVEKEIIKRKKTKRKDMLGLIIEEYESKQKMFNPNKPSPNKFIKNLEIRMKMYYKDLYK